MFSCHFRIRYLKVLLGLVALMLLASSTEHAALSSQNAPIGLRQVRTIYTEEMDVLDPAGLAFISAMDQFITIDSSRSSPSLAAINTLEELINSTRLAFAVDDPINTAFDGYGGSLFQIDMASQQLIEIRVDDQGRLRSDEALYTDIEHWGLRSLQGMTFDPVNGRLYLLDTADSTIVVVEPAAGLTGIEALRNGRLSYIDLEDDVLIDLRGIAFNPADEHLYLLSPSEHKLHELTTAGTLIANHDLSHIDIVRPQGMVFAPSGDPTDDPAEMGLYIVNGLQGQRFEPVTPPGENHVFLPTVLNQTGGQTDDDVGYKPGRIVELEFVFARPQLDQAAVTVQATLVQIIDTSQFSPASPDPAGLAYRPSSGTLFLSDSEVNEMSIYNGVNFFEISLTGGELGHSNTLAYSAEPTGVAYNSNDSHLFISDDDDREIYEIDPGTDGSYHSSDDIVTSFDTLVFNSTDPEGVAFDSAQGLLFIVDGVGREVYQVSPGINNIFDGVAPTGDDVVTHFDLDVLGVLDPEGIEFKSNTGTLLIADSNADTIYEVTTSGSLLQIIDTSAANPLVQAGIAYAPDSANTGVMNYYIADRRVDNNSNSSENDGKIYEMTIGAVAPTADFVADVVNGAAPLAVTLTNQSTGSPTTWNWDFGDGNTSTEQNPSHVYNNPGTYTVSLMVSNAQGSDSETKIDYVNVFDPGSAVTYNPTDDAHVHSTRPDNNYGSLDHIRLRNGNPDYDYDSYLKFNVTGLGGPVQSATLRLYVTDPSKSGGEVYGVSNSYQGSGTPWAESGLTWNNAPALGSTPLDQLANVSSGEWAEFDVTAAITSDGVYSFGMTTTSSDSVFYSSKEGGNPPQLVIQVQSLPTDPPTAAFSGAPTTGTAPLTVNFSDQSTGGPTSWAWDFGDGNTSTAQNPSHTYATPGVYTVSLMATNSAGSDTATQVDYITVNAPPPPTAAFNGTPTTGTAPLTVNFSDQSTGSPTSWAWDFGDGGTSAQQNPSHTYATPGVYTVSLTATNSAGSDTATRVDYITVNAPPPPTAAFNGTPTTGTAPLTVNFSDQTIGGPTSWSWDFGDGNTSTAQNPSHTYATPGVYTVSLTATNSAGSDTATQVDYITVTAPPPPTAAFNGTPTTGTAPLTVNFSDQTTGGPTSWAWDFGDGNTSTAQNPSHTYATPGVYTVSLMATNSAGSDTATQVDYITVNAPPPPTAAFNGTPTTGTAPLTVNFSDQSTGGPTSWAWDFGDGNTSTAQNPSHTYATPGVYTVSLMATNDFGSDTATLVNYVTVDDAPAILMFTPTDDVHVYSTRPDNNYGALDFIRLRYGNPNHDYDTYLKFNVTGMGGGQVTTATLRLYVTDRSKSGGEIYSVSNNYQGGSVPWTENGLTWNNAPALGSTPLDQKSKVTVGEWVEFDVTAAIAGDGVYSFGMTTTSSDSVFYSSKEGSNPPELIVNVQSVPTVPPTAVFSGTPTTGTAPLTVNFSDQSTGGPTSWAWDFGDGNTSTVQNPSHTYATPGVYTVNLMATNSAGSDTATQVDYITVTAPPPPTAAFNGTPTTGTAPLTVNFSDQSTGGPSSWSWDFGDGNTSTAQNPSHTYATPGVYTVSLTATNSAGSDTATQVDYITVTAPPPPTAAFNGTPTTGTAPLTVNFSDQTTGGPTSWAWDFGDGNTSTAQNPSHTYATPGVYTVSLMATNSAGSDTATQVDYITVTAPPPPTAAFNGAPTTGTAPLTVNFSDQSTGGPTSWAWDFGDGNTSTAQNPSHTYATPGVYTVSLMATNSAGSDTATQVDYITVSDAPSSLTFTPTDDAHVHSTRPDNNYGSLDHIRLRNGNPDYDYDTYLKFNVSGLGGSVQSAILRLYVTDPSRSGGEIYSVDNNYQGSGVPWTESGLTWNNAPAFGSTPLDQKDAVSSGVWVEYDVTAAIAGNGVYSFGMTTTSSDSVFFSSKEGGTPPELVITIGSSPSGTADAQMMNTSGEVDSIGLLKTTLD